MPQTVSLLVDAQNIYYTTRDAYQRRFDYQAFWDRACAGRVVEHAFAYSCDKGDPQQQKFQSILRGIGFEVKLKPYVQRADGSAKCDWDVGITIDALTCLASSDVIVLASGDGDFAMLVEKLLERSGRKVEVYGVPKLTAGTLMQAASRFVPIDDALLLPR